MQEQKTHLRTAQDRCLALERSNAELSAQLSETKERLAQMDTQVLLPQSRSHRPQHRCDVINMSCLSP